MAQNQKLPRPTGLPVRLSSYCRPMAPPAVAVVVNAAVPPMASRRGSLSRPVKRTLQLPGLARDVKSVQDLAILAGETTCVRKTASFHCLKAPVDAKRKLEPAESSDASRPKLQATTARKYEESRISYNSVHSTTGSADTMSKTTGLKVSTDKNCSFGPTPLSTAVMEDCEKVLQTLQAKAARNSSEFDDSVASFLSEQTDLLDVRLELSVASVTSDVADRTPSVEDLPMECEVVTPGAVTSAMSLDTGYQGDGELSRPESRNAESEVRLLKVQDDMKTMTDSDFFTESDADGHDDALGKRGDRKAQVIDGTLYGGPSERSQAEDMESSGIYSDLEKKPDPPAYQELISQQLRTIQSIVLCQRDSSAAPAEHGMVKSSSGDSSSTIQETPTVKVSPAGSVKKDTIRKNKMPNRKVESKVKTLIVSEAKTEAKPRTPKRGKWDAVMDKIAAGLEKQPPASRFRDVKSKVFQAVQTPRGSSGAVTPSLDSGKARSRRSTRVRSSESSLVSPKSKQSRTSANSSPHSSISDISASSSLPKSAWAAKKREGPCAASARDHVVSSQENRGSPRSREKNVGVTKGPVSNGGIKGSLNRRPNTPRLNPPLKDVNQNGVVTKSTSTNSITSTTPNLNNNNINYKNKVANRLSKTPVARPGLQKTPRDPAPALRRQLADSHKAVEALAALLNYCAQDLDAFKTPLLKKELEEVQCRMQVKELDLETSQSACRQLEEQLQGAHTAITELRMGEASVRQELEEEQRRAQAMQTDLETARADCRRLEGDVEAARGELQQLRADEAGYRAQLQTLSELSSRFDQVLNLKRESDDSLRESQKKNGVLIECLHDKESEVKLLAADNAKLREKLSILSLENKELRTLRVGAEKSKVGNGLDNELAESRKVKERPFENQRLSFNASRSSPEKIISPGDRSEHTLLSEVESLRQVLALKTEEVSELRRLELHLQVEADRVPKLLSLVTTLEAKVEDLQSQLSSQLDIVRNLNKVKETLQEELKSETAQKTRLSHKNEELQYKLRLNSDAMWQLVNRKMVDERTLECSSIGSSPRRFEDTRPQMVGVVQKSDSVSYMLDMGEDTEEVVNNIVRRAESMRSQTLPKKKRARTLGSADTTGDFFSCESASASPAVTPRRPGGSRACVRLLHSDFTTDQIELPREADCEVIEISGSFDHVEPDMSCSTSSNSSSNFDIESEVYADSPVMLRFPMDPLMKEKRLDPEGQDTDVAGAVEEEQEEGEDNITFLTPQVAAGEAMVSSDED